VKIAAWIGVEASGGTLHPGAPLRRLLAVAPRDFGASSGSMVSASTSGFPENACTAMRLRCSRLSTGT